MNSWQYSIQIRYISVMFVYYITFMYSCATPRPAGELDDSGLLLTHDRLAPRPHQDPLHQGLQTLMQGVLMGAGGEAVMGQ